MRKKACEVPEATDTIMQKQEVVQIPLWGTEPPPSDAVSIPAPSICLEMQGIRIEIHETGRGGRDPEYPACPASALLGDLSGVAKFYLVTGYTDMRKSIDGLMAVIRDTYEMDPYSNSLFLFCGRRCDRIKALHFEKDGFCLLYKRLDNGRFQWPRNSAEVRNLTRQEYRWLLEGLSIDQPRAIRPAGKKDF